MSTNLTVTTELVSALDDFNRRSAWLRDARWYGTMGEYAEARRAFDVALARVQALQEALDVERLSRQAVAR